MKKHLYYDLFGAAYEGEGRHWREVLNALGITCQKVTPQSMSDQILFWNCENIPENLPVYIKSLNANPQDYVGHGLTEDEYISLSEGE